MRQWQTWLFALLIFEISLTEDYFPDKPSVIDHKQQAFYERDEFYYFTLPVALVLLTVVFCVLCCTLFAREGICHLFDVPDELQRHDTQHHLTLDDYLREERQRAAAGDEPGAGAAASADAMTGDGVLLPAGQKAVGEESKMLEVPDAAEDRGDGAAGGSDQMETGDDYGGIESRPGVPQPSTPPRQEDLEPRSSLNRVPSKDGRDSSPSVRPQGGLTTDIHDKPVRGVASYQRPIERTRSVERSPSGKYGALTSRSSADRLERKPSDDGKYMDRTPRRTTSQPAAETQARHPAEEAERQPADGREYPTEYRTEAPGHRTGESEYRPEESAYRTDESGYRTDKPRYRTDEPGHRTDEAGHRRDDSGLRTGKPGYRTEDDGFRTTRSQTDVGFRDHTFETPDSLGHDRQTQARRVESGVLRPEDQRGYPTEDSRRSERVGRRPSGSLSKETRYADDLGKTPTEQSRKEGEYRTPRQSSDPALRDRFSAEPSSSNKRTERDSKSQLFGRDPPITARQQTQRVDDTMRPDGIRRQVSSITTEAIVHHDTEDANAIPIKQTGFPAKRDLDPKFTARTSVEDPTAIMRGERSDKGQHIEIQAPKSDGKRVAAPDEGRHLGEDRIQPSSRSKQNDQVPIKGKRDQWPAKGQEWKKEPDSKERQRETQLPSSQHQYDDRDDKDRRRFERQIPETSAGDKKYPIKERMDQSDPRSYVSRPSSAPDDRHLTPQVDLKNVTPISSRSSMHRLSHEPGVSLSADEQLSKHPSYNEKLSRYGQNQARQQGTDRTQTLDRSKQTDRDLVQDKHDQWPTKGYDHEKVSRRQDQQRKIEEASAAYPHTGREDIDHRRFQSQIPGTSADDRESPEKGMDHFDQQPYATRPQPASVDRHLTPPEADQRKVTPTSSRSSMHRPSQKAWVSLSGDDQLSKQPGYDEELSRYGLRGSQSYGNASNDYHFAPPSGGQRRVTPISSRSSMHHSSYEAGVSSARQDQFSKHPGFSEEASRFGQRGLVADRLINLERDRTQSPIYPKEAGRIPIKGKRGKWPEKEQDKGKRSQRQEQQREADLPSSAHPYDERDDINNRYFQMQRSDITDDDRESSAKRMGQLDPRPNATRPSVASDGYHLTTPETSLRRVMPTSSRSRTHRPIHNAGVSVSGHDQPRPSPYDEEPSRYDQQSQHGQPFRRFDQVDAETESHHYNYSSPEQSPERFLRSSRETTPDVYDASQSPKRYPYSEREHLRDRSPHTSDRYSYTGKEPTRDKYNFPQSPESSIYKDRTHELASRRYPSRQEMHERPRRESLDGQPTRARMARSYEHVDGADSHPSDQGRGYKREDLQPHVWSDHGLFRDKPSERAPPSDAYVRPAFVPNISVSPDRSGISTERNLRDPRKQQRISSEEIKKQSLRTMRPDYIDQPMIDRTMQATHEVMTAADGRKYLVPSASRLGLPASPRTWSGIMSPPMRFSHTEEDRSHIFRYENMPIGLTGRDDDKNGAGIRSEYSDRPPQTIIEHQDMEDVSPVAGNRAHAVPPADNRREERGSTSSPPSRQPSLLQRVRSVSVSRMSHSLRQMVSDVRPPSGRSRSEEPAKGWALRGTAAWLLDRIRSLRGVSEQPRKARDRRTQERRRHSQTSSSSTESTSSLKDLTSTDDLEEGEYVSPSRRSEQEQEEEEDEKQTAKIPKEEQKAGEESDHLKKPAGQSPKLKKLREDPRVHDPRKQRTLDTPTSSKHKPVKYVLEEHEGRKRIVSVNADQPEASPIQDKPGRETLSADRVSTPQSVEDSKIKDEVEQEEEEEEEEEKEKEPKKKNVRKRKTKDGGKRSRSEDSVVGSSKRKKSKSKKKKKKRSRKRSRSSSESSSPSPERETKTSKARKLIQSFFKDSTESLSEGSDYSRQSEKRDRYRDRSDAEESVRQRSVSRDTPRRYYSPREDRYSREPERTSYDRQTWRPGRDHQRQMYHQRRSGGAQRSPSLSAFTDPRTSRTPPSRDSRERSEARRSEERETPPDREPTPERGRAQLNRHGQPRHRPVVFQNDSLRAFVSQPSRRAQERRPFRGGGRLTSRPPPLHRPFQTNQSFLQQTRYSESPARRRSCGPRTPPLPCAPRPLPVAAPPRPPPRAGPQRDPRLCAASDRARLRECQLRQIADSAMSEQDLGCLGDLREMFDDD